MITSRSRVATPSSSKGWLAKAWARCGRSEIWMWGEDLFAQAVVQEGGLAVQAPPLTGMVHEGADQAGGQRRLEEHRHLAGGDLAAPVAGEGAAGGRCRSSAGPARPGRAWC